jgi:integrase
VQEVARLQEFCLSFILAETLRNALMPLRVIFRRAVEDGDLALNPCTHLRLPAVRGRRERIASHEEAQRLLAALPERDRPIWATALYAGLRRGELMALRWEDVDLAAGVIRVERAYDDKGRVEIEPKSRAGHRPISGARLSARGREPASSRSACTSRATPSPRFSSPRA